MSSTEQPKPTRARASRDAEESQRRRRRDPNDTSVVKRLALPEHKLDRANYVYRWVNDTPGRCDLLYRQDWDFVANDELEGGYTNERHGDVAQNRVPLVSRLMRKPIDYFNEDHAVRQKALDDELKAAELGRAVLNGQGSEGLQVGEATTYTPNISSNKL